MASPCARWSNVDFLQFASASRRVCLWTPLAATACSLTPTIGSYPRISCWELKHSFVPVPTTFVWGRIVRWWNSIILFLDNGFCPYTFIIRAMRTKSLDERDALSGWTDKTVLNTLARPSWCAPNKFDHTFHFIALTKTYLVKRCCEKCTIVEWFSFQKWKI